jgi:hypothetical protein
MGRAKKGSRAKKGWEPPWKAGGHVTVILPTAGGGASSTSMVSRLALSTEGFSRLGMGGSSAGARGGAGAGGSRGASTQGRAKTRGAGGGAGGGEAEDSVLRHDFDLFR